MAAEVVLHKLTETEPREWVPVPTAPALPPPPPPFTVRAWRTALQVLAAVSVRDVLLSLGLLLLGRGCYLVVPALGWGVPGAVLIWYALPQRPRFLEHVRGEPKPEPPAAPRRRRPENS